MPELKFTFEDDSEAISHYGVKGMHWGVWNAETAARHAGRKASRYRDKAHLARKKAASMDRTAGGGSHTAKKAKYQAKADKAKKKASRSQLDIRQSPNAKARNERKAEKYQRMAEGKSAKVDKVNSLNAKASKYDYKAEKYERKRGDLEAKQHQKNLRSLDSQIASTVIGADQYRNAMTYYDKKSSAASKKGDSQKAEKYKALHDVQKKKLSEVTEHQKDLGKQLVDEIRATESNGYSWRSRKYSFRDNVWDKNAIKYAKNLEKKHGKIGFGALNSGGYSSASSGNRFTVKNNPKNPEKYNSENQKLNTYRPQKVYYRYVYY